MGIVTEILTLLNRSQQRARAKAQTSTQNKGAWLEQVSDLATLRRLLQEMNHFLEGAEGKAENRYSQAQEQELLDSEHAGDLEAAHKLADERQLFEANDVGTIKGLLMRFKADAFGEAWRRLPVERRKELEAAKKRDGQTTQETARTPPPD